MAQLGVKTYVMHPDEIRPFYIYWINQLGASNIISSAWTVNGPDAALSVNSSSFDDKIATVFLEGGTAGKTYNIENRIGRSTDVAMLVWEFNVQIVDN